MPYFLEGNCVHKGTKEEPGEVVKCHDSPEEAAAHLKALYANVEDAEKGGEDATLKGGEGSGWHKPPRGSHTAENAPNFRGGPGADREYGTEEEEAPEGSKMCKCTKCNSTFTLPKGKQCQDVECPGCGGSAEQASPRRDKPAEGEEGGGKPGHGGKKSVEDCPTCEEDEKAVAASPSMAGFTHGQESMLGGANVSLGEDDNANDAGACKCPKCGKGLPCTAQACPHCKESIERVERGEDKSFVSYKSATGEWRWMTLSNWAVVDKEREVVSEQAYRDAIAYAQKSDDWGQLDLVHVDGTDVGDCDQLFILKGGAEPAKLGAGGTWYDTAKATRAREAIQAEPEQWGVSIKFRFNPERKVHGVYTGDIQVLKHSILPQEMAASYGTAIAVQGGNPMSKQLDEQAAEALRNLGHNEEEIAELAEKQKALPDEENVVEKEDTAESATEEAPPNAIKQFVAELGTLLGIGGKNVAPVASEPEEAERDKEVTEPANAVEPAETEKAGDDELETPPIPEDRVEEKAEQEETPGAGELLAALAGTVAKSVGEMVQKELEMRDKRIGELEALVRELGESVEEKVEQRLRDLPPVVKVAASEVEVTAVPDAKPKGLTFGQPPEAMANFNKALVADITRVVEDKMATEFKA